MKPRLTQHAPRGDHHPAADAVEDHRRKTGKFHEKLGKDEVSEAHVRALAKPHRFAPLGTTMTLFLVVSCIFGVCYAAQLYFSVKRM